jgi:hypothetical protein
MWQFFSSAFDRREGAFDRRRALRLGQGPCSHAGARGARTQKRCARTQKRERAGRGSSAFDRNEGAFDRTVDA